MVKAMANKKHLVASFHNLSPELQEEIKQKYPLGFTDAMIRVDKPNGDFFYAVPYDTDEISYLVKIDVKIDDLSEDEEEKEYYDDEIKGADDIQEESLPGGGGDGRRRGNLTAGAAGALPDFPRGRSGFSLPPQTAFRTDVRPAGGGPIPQAEPPRTRMEADRLFRPLLCRVRGLRVPVGKAPAGSGFLTIC